MVSTTLAEVLTTVKREVGVPDPDLEKRAEDPEPLPAVVYGTVTMHLCDSPDAEQPSGGE